MAGERNTRATLRGMGTTKRVELGPTAQTVRDNIARIRGRERITLRQLSARLTDSGRPLSHTSLSQIESGNRRVDVDDLVSIALALNVSPSTLLMPSTQTAGDKVTATGMKAVLAQEMWDWVTAASSGPPGSEIIDMDWVLRARPPWTFRPMTTDEARDMARRTLELRDHGND